jgi:hypothetical protein
MVAEQISCSILIVLGDHSSSMLRTIMQKLLTMLRQKIIRGLNGMIGVGGVVFVNNRERLCQNMNPEKSCDPQHPIPIFKHPEPLIQEAHFLQYFSPHKRSAGSVKTLCTVEFKTPIRTILSWKVDSGAILAD